MLPKRRLGGSSECNAVSLAKRIIPCLDVDQGRVVKGVNFVGIRDAVILSRSLVATTTQG